MPPCPHPVDLCPQGCQGQTEEGTDGMGCIPVISHLLLSSAPPSVGFSTAVSQHSPEKENQQDMCIKRFPVKNRFTGWHAPRRPAGRVGRPGTPRSNVPKPKGRTLSSYSWRVSSSVLFGPSTDWTRPTHTGQGNLLYWVHPVKSCSHPKISRMTFNPI